MVNTPVIRGCGEVADKVPEIIEKPWSRPALWVGLISIIFLIWTVIGFFK